MASMKKLSTGQGNNYSFLESLTRDSEGVRIKVRVSRMWDVFNLKNNRDLMSTDMVLIDEKGSYIHATIKSNIAHRFREIFYEGGIYFIKNFCVADNRSKYRVVADNKVMLQLYANTTVTEVDNEDANFPRHRFDFVDFDKIENRKGQDYILTDVIGRVIGEGNVQKTKARGKDVNYLTLELEDIWEKRIRITLWDRSAIEYERESKLLGNTLIIGVFTSNLVKDYMRSTTLSTTSATKIYLNMESPEVSEFKGQYRSSDGDDNIKSLEVHRQAINRESILSNKKTIREILDIVAAEFEEGTNYFCQATILDICNNNGWYYNSCPRCKRLIKPAGDKFWCNHCQKSLDDAVPSYRLELEVSDESGTSKFIVFDEEAEKLIGQSATSLYDLEAKKEGADYEDELPFLIKNLTSSSYVFRVKLTSYNKTAYKQSFTANKVLDETILEDRSLAENTVTNQTTAIENGVTNDGIMEVEGNADIANLDANGGGQSGPSLKKRRLRIIETDDEQEEPIEDP